MRIENWSIVCANVNPYSPPECQVTRIRGRVFGHPDFTDGDLINTSPINHFENGCVVTNNSKYELGAVDPDYLKLFPSAAKLLEAGG